MAIRGTLEEKEKTICPPQKGLLFYSSDTYPAGHQAPDHFGFLQGRELSRILDRQARRWFENSSPMFATFCLCRRSVLPGLHRGGRTAHLHVCTGVSPCSVALGQLTCLARYCLCLSHNPLEPREQPEFRALSPRDEWAFYSPKGFISFPLLLFWALISLS